MALTRTGWGPQLTWAAEWTNVPDPAAYRPMEVGQWHPPLAVTREAFIDNINELGVGFISYKRIIKRMREWVRETVGRMRDVKWAETEYAPPRSIAGGRGPLLPPKEPGKRLTVGLTPYIASAISLVVLPSPSGFCFCICHSSFLPASGLAPNVADVNGRLTPLGSRVSIDHV